MNKLLRTLPKVDDLLNCAMLSPEASGLSRSALLVGIRTTLQDLREKIISVECNDPLELHDILKKAISAAKYHASFKLCPAINATGIVLHTNLGRAPLGEVVAEHVKQVALSYCTLEYNVQSGKRGSRTQAVENMLCNLTNAEAACIVNNNAAAVLLVLSALCMGREVVVSRSELVEIGGSFRVPDVISQGGAILREIGATNKVRISDYASAIGQNTSALLKVHTSNYKIVGFFEEVNICDLKTLAKEHNLPLIYDLGSGSFASIGDEPTVKSAISAGADLICFSGDKLLGSAQAGIIVGKKEYINKLRVHPLYRALRIDKLSLAALEATLSCYEDLAEAEKHIPTLSMLLADESALFEKAKQLLTCLAPISSPKKFSAKIQETLSQAGGGSLPEQNFSSWAVAISPSSISTATLESSLRCWKIPIVTRIHKEQLLLDVRTIDVMHFPVIQEAFEQIFDDVL
ncbi:MAG: L-seryl-tRNA(Sec) selenium transferase [Defluviitaleaceae bacterium]|nr:L-seryl-tRNA(Sec) selenium transferase [Defluviitaleaceae bacterium]